MDGKDPGYRTGYRSLKEGRDAKRAYSFEALTASMDWPCHKNA